jgi:periplasmic divalent cation tolerance protein
LLPSGFFMTENSQEPLAIGWTTFEKLEEAQSCAKALIAANLAFCVQVESPVQSFYEWEGNVEESREYPVRIKYVAAMDEKIQKWLRKNHPYETPQWIAIKACTTLPEYHCWTLQNFHPPVSQAKNKG